MSASTYRADGVEFLSTSVVAVSTHLPWKCNIIIKCLHHQEDSFLEFSCEIKGDTGSIRPSTKTVALSSVFLY